MRVPTILALLGTALLTALAAWAALLIIPVCDLDLGPLGRLDHCPPPAERSTELESEIERQALLADRLDALQRQLAMFPGCPPAPPPPEPPPDPDRLDAEKWQEGDITLLEGCWSLASDYSVEDVETGEVTDVETWEMRFDGQGRGDQEFLMPDGRTCSEPVTAVFVEDGRLRIDDRDDVHCSDLSYVYRRIMTCDLEPGGEAACQNRRPELGWRRQLCPDCPARIALT
ncbi:MAG: hypothetical protein OXQ84_15800 [bacterium]|nr:hypothetical protein [bacterium]